MRRETYKNLRYSEKVRESQCFIEADGLQKKIRKFNAGRSVGKIDAEMKMREIECFWKEGWEYNHTHHIYLEPKVTRPQFYLPCPREEYHQKLERYYQLLQMYLTRLKIDNEDETNFKIDQRGVPLYVQQAKEGKSEIEMEIQGVMQFDEIVNEGGISRLAFEHLARVFGESCQEMLANFSRSLKISQNEMMDGCLDEQQFTHLPLLSQACRTSLEEDSIERQHTEWFMRLMMEVVQQANSSKQYSAVISTQPQMGELSTVLHPLCWGLYSTFSKEILVKQAKHKRGRRYADEQDQPLVLNASTLRQTMVEKALLVVKDEIRLEEQSHSRVAFINFDGFESEFTLQFMRNFAENVMYVSFPKFESGEGSTHYRQRFHKKIMYNFTRSELDILGCYDDKNMDAINLTIEREDLMNNPEKYHETIDQLYHPNKSNTKPKDFNRNLYVFPIGLDNLSSQQDISVGDKKIDGYESHFIRFILRDHIYSALRAFKPKLVFISYSGKLHIQNEHFLEMLQEVIKICPKVALFPNFTSVFTKCAQCTTHSVGRGIISKDDQRNLYNRVERHYNQKGNNPWQVAFMDKLSVFLKVTAGYYTLQRPFEEEDIATKFNNTRVFRYIIFLYHALKNQYEHCKRRVQPATLETARASLQVSIKEHSKEISRCIPQYYTRLFQFISELLRNNLQENEYSLTAEQIRDKFPPTFEEDEPYLQQWVGLQRGEELMLAGAKYQEISQLQIRQKASRDDYLSVKDERMNNLESLYRISFYYKEDSNQIVKLYKDVVLLWKEQQPIGRNCFHVILSNLFTPGEQEIHHYIAKPKINVKKMQRCQIIPITFHSRQGLISRENIFKVWTEWNYAETAHQVLLYWPSEFDFISYYLNKLLQRKYEPNLIRRLFAAKKTNESLGKHDSAFYEINIGENLDVAPRWGCSSFNVDDQLYILGGSYDSEHSYLNLQNDVTTIDLTDNNPENYTPAKLRNINKDIYVNEAFWGKLRQGREVNSFVRPRQEFQFYDHDELAIEEGAEQTPKDDEVRRIYMIGGYGEEFKTPYSLFVNYFYEIVIERASRRLISIRKRVIPERVIPINVRAMIKNRGVYQKGNILELSQMVEQQQKCKEGVTNNRHYFHHQVVYAIKNGQLHYKIKNLFATELYEHSKRDFQNFARRMGEIKNAQEPETVLIRKVEGNKHQVLVEINDIYYIYSLNLQLKGEEVEEIPLMNESIISLDTKKLVIFALISHSRHTNSRTILATESVRIPSQAIIIKEKHYGLVLKEVMRFQGNLNLHTLIICNVNEIVLLHGIGFEKCRNRQFMIKMKSKLDIKKEELNVLSVSPHNFSAITTFFSKKNNIITSINFIQHAAESQYFDVHGLLLDINRFSDGWKQNSQANKICFIHGDTILQRTKLQMRIDNYADINSVILLLYASSGKVYHVKLWEIFNIQGQLVQVEQITDRTVLERLKCMECLARIVKNEELYDDFEYFE